MRSGEPKSQQTIVYVSAPKKFSDTPMNWKLLLILMKADLFYKEKSGCCQLLAISFHRDCMRWRFPGKFFSEQFSADGGLFVDTKLFRKKVETVYRNDPDKYATFDIFSVSGFYSGATNTKLDRRLAVNK